MVGDEISREVSMDAPTATLIVGATAVGTIDRRSSTTHRDRMPGSSQRDGLTVSHDAARFLYDTARAHDLGVELPCAPFVIPMMVTQPSTILG